MTLLGSDIRLRTLEQLKPRDNGPLAYDYHLLLTARYLLRASPCPLLTNYTAHCYHCGISFTLRSLHTAQGTHRHRRCDDCGQLFCSWEKCQAECSCATTNFLSARYYILRTRYYHLFFTCNTFPCALINFLNHQHLRTTHPTWTWQTALNESFPTES